MFNYPIVVALAAAGALTMTGVVVYKSYNFINEQNQQKSDSEHTNEVYVTIPQGKAIYKICKYFYLTVFKSKLYSKATQDYTPIFSCLTVLLTALQFSI